MAMTSTPNINLTKPDYSEIADVQVLNQNADKIDAAVGGLQNGFAIIVDGDRAGMAVAPGAYAYIKNNTHGLAEGLYKNKSSSAFPTSGATASSTVFEAVSGGIGNEVTSLLNSKITNAIELRQVTLTTDPVGWAYPSIASNEILISVVGMGGYYGFVRNNSGDPCIQVIMYDAVNSTWTSAGDSQVTLILIIFKT
jgi:hypothetical protein